MTRFLLVFLLTQILHAAETGSEIKNNFPNNVSYTIMTSRLKSQERRKAYRLLFGKNDDVTYSRHQSMPHFVRQEILKLRESLHDDEDTNLEKIEACDNILLLFPL